MLTLRNSWEYYDLLLICGIRIPTALIIISRTFYYFVTALYMIFCVNILGLFRIVYPLSQIL